MMPLARRAALPALLLVLGLFALQGVAATKNKAGDFDYYALVLSWSPTFCSGGGGSQDDEQCNATRPYAFVLHGLWPQYEKGWPEECDTGNRPWVPKATIKSMLDIMPSPKLVIHEYRKHGVCSGLDADAYFALARKLYSQVKIPPPYVAPSAEIQTTPDEIEKSFLAANPGLKPDMIAVSCGRRDRLKEIHVCFSPSGELRACGQNEDAGRLCRSRNVAMPPVRGGKGGSSI